ncbi:MAG: hypothetical protein F2801_10975 [Actinobacteria bacterium]|nr:hypothetical protein [Actinomycetota bacterium]
MCLTAEGADRVVAFSQLRAGVAALDNDNREVDVQRMVLQAVSSLE